MKVEGEDSECDYYVYRLRVNSENGRAFAALNTDIERYGFMRKYADERMGTVSPNQVGWGDEQTGKCYVFELSTPEGKRAEGLCCNSTERLARLHDAWRPGRNIIA